MRNFSFLKSAILTACLIAAGSASAQDIKLGYNGDLSASPSAQSGQAAVLGMDPVEFRIRNDTQVDPENPERPFS